MNLPRAILTHYRFEASPLILPMSDTFPGGHVKEVKFILRSTTEIPARFGRPWSGRLGLEITVEPRRGDRVRFSPEKLASRLRKNMLPIFAPNGEITFGEGLVYTVFVPLGSPRHPKFDDHAVGLFDQVMCTLGINPMNGFELRVPQYTFVKFRGEWLHYGEYLTRRTMPEISRG